MPNIVGPAEILNQYENFLKFYNAKIHNQKCSEILSKPISCVNVNGNDNISLTYIIKYIILILSDFPDTALSPHSVPKGTKSGKLKTRKGRASLKTRKGRASSKTREGLVIIKTSKASLNLKRALWRDKPSGLLPENCPNFFFFFVWAEQF
jgi:hypothetical protein